MKILLLGGTGAMGEPLAKLLAQDEENAVYVTSRNHREDSLNIHYIQGNAINYDFLQELLVEKYDVIVDFLVYKTEQLKERIPLILSNTDQYFFFSSARCYAKSSGLLREDSSRLIDVCTDPVYLATDEYALAKGREENILMESGRKNWTIIRPYITYNSQRIQLGVYEKENWLRRALEGRTIVFPNDIAQKKTSLTYGEDVAKALSLLMGNCKAYGEAFHVVTSETHTWGEILDFYCRVIEDKTKKKIKVKLVDSSEDLQKFWNPWQIKYDRLFDREFDNAKIASVVGQISYKPTYEGLEKCLDDFLKSPKWLNMNWTYEAWCDKQCREWSPITDISTTRAKYYYLKNRLFH